MRKFLLSALTMLLCGSAYALPVGNPTEASLYTHGLWWNDSSCCDPCDPCGSWCDAFSVRLGFYGDYVFNRHLEVKSTSQIIAYSEIDTNAGIVVLNFCDWIDLFATFGATNISMEADAAIFGGDLTQDNSLNQLQFSTEFSWSVGGRATVWECGNFGVGVEGQYFRTKPNLNTIYIIADTSSPTANNGTTYSEWQVGLGASYTYSTGCPGVALIPYMGLKWAKATLNTGNLTFLSTVNGLPLTVADQQSQKLWGYAVGVTATVNDMVGVTVEGRFADEKALYTSLQMRF